MSDPIYPPPPVYPPYPPNQGGPSPYGSPPTDGTPILVMGIFSLFCFGIILGPIAWVQGNNALRTINTYGDPTNQRGVVTAGRICGIIGTILHGLVLVFYVVLFLIGMVQGITQSSSPTAPTPVTAPSSQ